MTLKNYVSIATLCKNLWCSKSPEIYPQNLVQMPCRESIYKLSEYFQSGFFMNFKDYIIQTVTEKRLGEVCCQKNKRLNILILTRCNQQPVAKL